MQHCKGEGCPVSTIRMHRGVLGGAGWYLATQIKSVLHTKITNTRTQRKHYIHKSLLHALIMETFPVYRCKGIQTVLKLRQIWQHWKYLSIFTATSRLAPASISIWTRASSPAAQAYIRGVIPCNENKSRSKCMKLWRSYNTKLCFHHF